MEFTLVGHVVGAGLDGVAGLGVLLHVLDEIHVDDWFVVEGLFWCRIV